MNILNKIQEKLVVKWFRRKLTKAAIIEGKRLRLAENGYIFHNSNLKVSFYVPNYETDLIQQIIVTEKTYYEHDELRHLCSEYDNGIVGMNIRDNCVLDIGSNIGNHSLYFLFECGARKIHCFEPMPQVFAILKKNIEINNVEDKVVLHNVAVGAVSTKAELLLFEKKNLGASQFGYNDNGDYPVVAIDDLNLSDNIKFVKIDVEGFEFEVLKGMMKTIESHRPYMMIEIRSDNFENIVNLLSPIGYTCSHIGGINYLFIPNK